MSSLLLPLEINKVIIDFTEPDNMTAKEVKNCGRVICAVLSNKGLRDTYSDKLAKFKKINELVNKYYRYNNIYECRLEDHKQRPDKVKFPGGNPQLLDALFTECNLLYAAHTVKKYTEVTERDIKSIIELTPQSVNCVIGTLRYGNAITPLFAACINERIPISIIEFLFEKGANPKETYDSFVGAKKYRIRDALVGNIPYERFCSIAKLFKKYENESIKK